MIRWGRRCYSDMYVTDLLQVRNLLAGGHVFIKDILFEFGFLCFAPKLGESEKYWIRTMEEYMNAVEDV